MASKTTIDLKKRTRIFGIVSTFMWIGTALASVIAMFFKLDLTSSSGTPIFSEEFKAILISIGTTALIGITVACFIKNKIRTFMWMICLVLDTAAFQEAGMYIVLALWLIDEYVIYALYNHYKKRLTINKEIDLRME